MLDVALEINARAFFQYAIPLLVVGWVIHRQIKEQRIGSRVWKVAIGFWITAFVVTGPRQDGPVRDLLLPLYDGSPFAIRAKVASVIFLPFLLVYIISTIRKTLHKGK